MIYTTIGIACNPKTGTEYQVPRKPLADKGVQTSLRLPRELYDRLAAEAGDQGIGEEIRQRLEASFLQNNLPEADERFRDVLNAISKAAPVAARMESPGAQFSGYHFFELGVSMLLEMLRPEGEPAPEPDDWWHGIA